MCVNEAKFDAHLLQFNLTMATMRTLAVSFVALAAALSLNSCALRNMENISESPAVVFNQKIQVIAIEIANRLRDFEPNDQTVAVVTFVDLDNMDEATSFGRYVSEQIGSELYKLGFKVRELRQRKDVEVVQDKGEFYLTRKSAELMRKSKVDAVVTGTFTLVGEEVVVNSRLIGVDSGKLASVGEMVVNVAQNEYLGNLLNRNSSRSRPVIKARSAE